MTVRPHGPLATRHGFLSGSAESVRTNPFVRALCLGAAMTLAALGSTPSALAAVKGPRVKPGAVLVGARGRPSQSQGCDTWTGGSGMWSTPADWSKGVPTGASNVCISAPGTYTVTIEGLVSVNSLSLGGPTGKQTLYVESNKDSESEFGITANSLIKSTGSLVLGSYGSKSVSYPASIASSTGGTVINEGSFLTNGSYEDVVGCDLINAAGGTVTLAAPMTMTGSFTIENSGKFSVLKGATYEMSGAYFIQKAGVLSNMGSITSANAAKFNQQGGNETGNPVQLEGFVTFKDAAGKGTFILSGDNTLSGTVPKGQTVTSLSTKSVETVTNLAAPGVTNDGTLAVESTSRGSEDELATAPLTNKGTLEVMSVGSGDEINANLINKPGATVDVSVNSKLLNNAKLTNEGTYLMGKGAALTVSPTASFVSMPSSTVGATVVASGGPSSSMSGGSISLAGTLRITTLGKPKTNEAYLPIWSTKRTGTFARVVPRGAYRVSYLPTAVRLTFRY